MTEFGSKLIINGDVKYIGEGDDPADNPIMKAYAKALKEVYQPERSKREDLDNNANFFPPPWNIYDHPEKTEGWIEFQREMRKDPDYYLGCGTLNSMET